MKKTLALAMGLVLTASVSFAADAPSSSTAVSSSATSTTAASSTATSSTTSSGSDSGKMVIQLQGGLTIPTSSGLANFTTAGPSIEGMIGYAFSKDFTLGLESGVEEWDTQSKYGVGGINHVPLELVGQYNFAGGPVVPYVDLGVGLAFDWSTNFISSQTNFELDPGIGVAFNLAKDFNLFVQGKLAMDFNSTGKGGESIAAPNSATPDSPLMSIPVQLGVNFLL